ncbi:hypothetical protein [Caulobacter sp. S45]|uniref:hypothetical protein n=1 Tax=Caulobacter sp. S45 TaxID=1641861 RepID=UPI00131EAC2F|nr:hypothetical protein [Caulobacter sp. S45]
MTRRSSARSANRGDTRLAAWFASALTSVVLIFLFAHADPTELAILAGASALCYFEVVFALRLATTDKRASLLFRAARRSALDLARQKPPELFRHVSRAAPYLRRSFPARPFVGQSRNSHGLDVEAAPICGFAFA